MDLNLHLGEGFWQLLRSWGRSLRSLLFLIRATSFAPAFQKRINIAAQDFFRGALGDVALALGALLLGLAIVAAAVGIVGALCGTILNKFPMLCLPDELILAIAECLSSSRDLNALSRVNHRLLRCLEPVLYAWPGSHSTFRWADGDEDHLPLPKTALLWGIEWGRDDVVRKALCFNTDGVGLALRRALSYAIPAVWSLLLPIYSVEKYGTAILEKCLREAAYLGQKGIAEALMTSGKMDFEDMRMRKASPLCSAAAGGSFELFEFLMNSGEFELDNRDEASRTPLSYAAGVGAEDIVRLLLDTGKVDVDVRTKTGFTPLMYSALLGHKALAQRLLDTGEVDVNARDFEQFSVLHYAVMEEHVEVTKLLLGANDIDVNPRDSEDWTPLIHAVAAGHAELVQIIIATGKADIDARDNEGGTALLHAIMISDEWTVQERIVDMLLATGKADVLAVDNSNDTLLEVAKKLERMDLHQKMLEAQSNSIKPYGQPLKNKGLS
ncbi:hypothetical protein NLG97_g3791 [Lecanicillium saksenae]|uniref:Uncharacterized protein n=1 Tax=Lecanicillium saksenae TaxID=468837 RepID=A0ACC1QX35_9HYPO|nr:hypothetical protein NLG97_g3791 [Lecanicillium saksenae]